MSINSAWRVQCAPDWSWDTGATNFTDRDLWTVLAGEGVLHREDVRHTVSRGDVFVLDGETRIRANHSPDQPLTVMAVHFEGGGPLPFHVRILPVEFLAGILDRLLGSRLRGDGAAACRWLQAALDEVRTASQWAMPESKRAKVAAMASRIRDCPGDDWRVSLLAEGVQTSEQHLSRLFREHSGRSPKEYILWARMEAACAYLRGSSLSIKRIADELGFHDEFHFSKTFRNRVGVSPAKYRSSPEVPKTPSS